VYAYADEDPIRWNDPYGLFKTSTVIDFKPVIDPSSICGSPFACSLVGAAVACDCRCTSSGYFADAILIVGGTVYYYNGPFASIKKKPKDPKVKNAQSAITHEFEWHIDLAIDQVAGIVTGLENTPHESLGACRKDCAAVSLQVKAAFAAALRDTQANENR
jgi:hypothetical protein